MSGTILLPLVSATRLRLFITTALGFLLLATLVACTPDEELAVQQVAGAAETIEALSIGATTQAIELASLRATLEAPTPLPAAMPTTEPSPTIVVTVTATVQPTLEATVLPEPTVLPTPTVIPTALNTV